MSTPVAEWHADSALIQRYVGGGLDPATAASVEAHVLKCAACRASFAVHAPQPRLSAVWTEVTEALDAPWRGVVERALARLGLSESDARLAASAPALRAAWFIALIAVLAFCLAASESGRIGPNLFLVLAPALPTLGVGLAYGKWADPTYDVGQAAPYSAVRLLFLRTAVVLAVTVVVVGVTGLVLPGKGTAVLWLLPSLALVTATLALSALVPPVWAAAMTCGSWLVGVSVLWQERGSIDPIFGAAGQLTAAVVLVVAALAIVGGHRVHAYDVRRFL
jgi:hypothetical protein